MCKQISPVVYEGRSRAAGKRRSADTVRSCSSRMAVHFQETLKSYRLNSEAENMSVTFFQTTWHADAVGHFNYFRLALRRHFMDLFCTLFFTFEFESPFVAIVWEMTAAQFSYETPAASRGLKNFRPAISMRVSQK